MVACCASKALESRVVDCLRCEKEYRGVSVGDGLADELRHPAGAVFDDFEGEWVGRLTGCPPVMERICEMPFNDCVK